MESLCTPWGLPPPAYSFNHQQNRSRFGSTLEIRDTCPTSTQQDLLPRRQRSPSLPPISNYHQEQNNNIEMNDSNNMTKYVARQSVEINNGTVKYRYEEGEGETSGYASDCVPQSSPEYWQNKQKYMNLSANNNRIDTVDNTFSNYSADSRNHLPIAAWQQNPSQDDDRQNKRWNNRDISSEDQRARWGDRGVAAGRLWEPREPGARLPQVTTKGTPSWVERSLNMIDNGDSQILLIDQQSNSSMMSDQQLDKNTYLLGQNAPIEPTIKAEREFRRLKALELQAAIVQQLEDREKQKREEKERQIREEREEEERFRKQQELERQRLEDERRIAEEKQKREQKRAEALRLALERAEQQAKLDKENKKNRRMRENFDAMSLNSEIDFKSMDRSPRKESNQNPNNGESKLIQNIYIEQAFSPRRKIIQEQVNKSYGCQGTTETNIIMSHPQSGRFRHQSDSISSEQNVKKNVETPRQNVSDPMNSATSHGNQPMSLLSETPLSLVQIPLTQELFAPINFAHNNGMQMALLVPPINNLYPCVHQPISMQNLFSADASSLQRNFHMHCQTDTDDTSSNKDIANKILTPSKYRNCKDASTQTDAESVSLKNLGIVEEKGKRRTKLADSNNELYTNLEQNTSEEKLNTLMNKKEKRHQSEERLASKDLENRPKWGVNKPPTQYKKQSEKDIFYTQKRKLRLRKRTQEKNYTSHSSDDNRSPSPTPIINNKSSNEKNRVSLSDYHWRKKTEKQDGISYPSNLIVETTQISPLECDANGGVHVNENFSVTSKRTYEQKRHKKGISMSQKFMNDKYGNPKLWQSEKQDSILPPELINGDNKTRDVSDRDKVENRKKYNDNLNRSKRDQSNYYSKEQEANQPLVLDQLRSLKESLKKQQQIWGKYEARRSPSPKNEVDLEME